MSSYLDLVTILCRDLDRTTWFYTELLGFSVVDEFTRPGDFVWLRSEKRGCSLVLQNAQTRAKNPVQADIPEQTGGLMLGFDVDDVTPYYDKWVAQGLSVRTEIVDMGKGLTFGTNDPEGNYVQVVAVHPQFREVQHQLGLH